MLKIHLQHLLAWLLALIGAPIAIAACTTPGIGPFSMLLAWAYFCLPPVLLFRIMLGMNVFTNEFLLPQSGFEGFLAAATWLAICWFLAAATSLQRVSEVLRQGNSVGQSPDTLPSALPGRKA
jgi:hypothetical protein